MSIDATKFVWTLSKEVVTPLEKLILLAIADRCGECGECWPSISRLCKDTNLSQDAVRRHRTILIQKKLLTYTGQFLGRSKQIPVMKLMIDEWREGGYVEDQIDPPAVATPSQESVVPLAGKVGYPPAVATQNLKEEPKQEPKNINTKNSLSPIDYQETYYEPKNKNNKLSLNALKFDNPHNIPTQMIDDWMTTRKIRKAPVTQTVWNKLNKELAKCGNPVDAFEEMVAAGWQSFKAEWIKSGTEKLKSHFDNESTEWIETINERLF